MHALYNYFLDLIFYVYRDSTSLATRKMSLTNNKGKA